MRAARKDGQLESTHGGKREKKSVDEALDEWFHPDAREAMDVFFKMKEEKYAAVLKGVQQTYGDMTLPMELETDTVVFEEVAAPLPQQDDIDEDSESGCSVISDDDEVV